MKTLNAKWTGIRPLLMHNGQLADQTNPYVVEIKKITAKGKKKTDTDYANMARLEWEGGLYWDETLGPVIMSDAIERCIQVGAQKSRLGKDVLAAVFCQETCVPVEYKGPREKEKMWANPDFCLRRGVGVNGSRVMRCRPMFREWAIEFTVEYDDSIINEKNLIQAMQDAGALCGLGDWRPKFGRFTVTL